MKEKTLEERKKDFECLKNKHPDKIPMIIDRHPNYPSLEFPTKDKYLINESITIGEFKNLFRTKYFNISSEFLIKIKIFSVSEKIEISDNITVKDLYNEYKDEDGFLYLYYSYEIGQVNNETKSQVENILKQFPDKIPIILSKHKNYPNIKNILKNKYLVLKDMTIHQYIIYLCKSFFDEKLSLYNIKFGLSNNEKSEPFKDNELIENIYNQYKSENGFLYLYYFYEPKISLEVKEIVNKLPLFVPLYKINNSLQTRKELIEKYIITNNIKIPIILEKYPLSKKEDKSKKLLIEKTFLLNDLFLCLKQKFEENFEFALITDKNIILEKDELINDIYNKYKDEDNALYLFYIEPEKILIIVEKNDKEYNDILYFNPNDEIDSLKMKIWRQIDKPFMIIELMDKNKNIIKNYSKIIDLYNDLKDNEDEFLYLYFKCSKPLIENSDKQENEFMSEAYKIFLLFKRIPFVFKPSTSFKNSKMKKKVFISYQSKSSTFKEIQTDKQYKYYLEYPNKEVNINENIVDFYLANKNNKDDFLYLIIENEN